jgi:uncharacterized delta-60 repeat protein
MKKFNIIILLVLFSQIILCAQKELDSNFGKAGKVKIALSDNWCAGETSVLQKDGKIIIGGWVDNEHYIGLVRLMPDGSFDKSFGENGKVIFPVRLKGHYLSRVIMGLMSDGSIVVGGNGLVDKNINLDAKVKRKNIMESDDALVVIDHSGIEQDKPEGETIDVLLMKLTRDGQIDKEFGEKGLKRIDVFKDDATTSLLIDSKDNIYVAGLSETFPDTKNRAIYAIKLDKKGELITSFANKGKFIVSDKSFVSGACLGLNKNELAVAGLTFTENEGEYGLSVYSLDKNGKLKTNFANSGCFTFNDEKLLSLDVQLKYYKNKLFITANATDRNNKEERKTLFIKLDKNGKFIPIDATTNYKMIYYPQMQFIMDACIGPDYILLGGTGQEGEEYFFMVEKIDHNGNLLTSFGNEGALMAGFQGEGNLGMKIFEDTKKNIIVTGTVGWIDLKYGVIKIIDKLETSFLEKDSKDILERVKEDEKNLNAEKPNVLMIYPNPVINQQATLSLELNYSSNINYRVFDMQGKLIQEKNCGTFDAGTNQLSLDFSAVSQTGSYLIQIATSKEVKTLKLFIKN